ncbi:hypothetical protein scyTo_0016686, partial [Scyliorhinus torazame]|nr:hypothetical protein [Scyliorhinus torazame]
MLDNPASALTPAEKAIEDQPHSLLQSTPIIPEESTGSVQQAPVDSTAEAVSDHPVHQQLLQYIEARQQILLSNIGYCNSVLELLSNVSQ